jgi:integrating conjugative element protein (TIGR03765 family)
MTASRTRFLSVFSLTILCAVARLSAQESGRTLTVVKDFGGVSALPYYNDLNIQASPTGQVTQPAPSIPEKRDDEAHTLPIHSTLLSPGEVTRRVIAAPGLSPIFLVGDDTRSRVWLSHRAETLRSIRAIGFAVQVATEAELTSLRALVPGVAIVATPGDDLARRLRIEHYPVLITATGIEQ